MGRKHQVVHIGTLPPPLGGISVYLYRLSKLHSEWHFVDEGKMSKLGWVSLFFKKNCLFVYHSPNQKKRLLLMLMSMFTNNEYGLVIHGDVKPRHRKSGWMFKKMLEKADYLQVLTQQDKDYIIHVMKVKNTKIVVRNAFLPPPLEDEGDILATYDGCLLKFINAKGPLIVANASSLVFYQGEDLYGLDLCVELVSKLKKEYRDIGLLFALAKVGDEEYFRKIKARISELGIENNIYFMTGQKELWPLFKKADLMVRSTNTDGDAVSIREAIYLDCPTIASDVRDRPEETVLFRNRDIDDLYEKSLQVLRTSRKAGKKNDKEM